MYHHLDRQWTRVVLPVLGAHLHNDAGLEYCPIELKLTISLRPPIALDFLATLRQQRIIYLKVV